MVRNQADYDDSQFVSDLELVDTLNFLRTELYTQVVDRCEPPRLMVDINLVVSNGLAIIPEDVYKILSVSNEVGEELSEAHFTPVGKKMNKHTYFLQGDTIRTEAQSINIKYFPIIEDIELPEEDEDNEWIDDPEIRLICPEEAVFLRAGLVSYILTKDESDPSTAMMEKINAYNRIISTFQQKNIQPYRVRKVI